MSNQFWNQVKSKYRLGELIHGKVEHHAPFGIFVDVGDDAVHGRLRTMRRATSPHPSPKKSRVYRKRGAIAPVLPNQNGIFVLF
jgi:hypothetical protein